MIHTEIDRKKINQLQITNSQSSKCKIFRFYYVLIACTIELLAQVSGNLITIVLWCALCVCLSVIHVLHLFLLLSFYCWCVQFVWWVRWLRLTTWTLHKINCIYFRQHTSNNERKKRPTHTHIGTGTLERNIVVNLTNLEQKSNNGLKAQTESIVIFVPLQNQNRLWQRICYSDDFSYMKIQTTELNVCDYDIEFLFYAHAHIFE